MEEEEGMRARSFRKEDYNNRRAFLRSYPLQWEDTDDDDDGNDGRGQLKRGQKSGGGGGGGGGDRGAGKGGKGNKLDSLKQRVVVAVSRWGGGKVLLLRKLKNKVAFYLFACQPPFGFHKPNTNHLLTT